MALSSDVLEPGERHNSHHGLQGAHEGTSKSYGAWDHHDVSSVMLQFSDPAQISPTSHWHHPPHRTALYKQTQQMLLSLPVLLRYFGYLWQSLLFI